MKKKVCFERYRGMFALVALGLSCFLALPCGAAEPSAQPQPELLSTDYATSPLAIPLSQIRKISIQELVRLTLERNLDVKISDYDKAIAREEITAQKGIFDLLVSARLMEQKIESPLPATYPGTPSVDIEKDKAFDLSLKQLFPTGGFVELLYNDTWTRTNSTFALFNPYYSTYATLSVVQPLLKNFGPYITTAQIRIARNNQKVSIYAFRQQLITQLADVINTYWELVFAIRNYDVQKMSLDQAQDLLRINKIKYETGVLPRTDVLLAEAQVAARKEQLLLAAKAIRDVQDSLKQRLNIARTSEEWQIQLVPEDKPIYHAVQCQEAQCFDIAFKNRPDYQQAHINLENLAIDRRVAQNQKLPEVNLFGDYGFSALDRNYEETKDQLGTLDYNQWQAGIEFIYPLQNRTATARYTQSVLRFDQMQERIRSLENAIMLNVRNVLRQLSTDLQRIEITQVSVEYERAKLADEEKRYAVGLATSHDVLEYQRDLATAQVNHLRAVVDYNKSLVDLTRSTGTLLEHHGIKVDEEGALSH
jgi:outer membrane protein